MARMRWPGSEPAPQKAHEHAPASSRGPDPAHPSGACRHPPRPRRRLGEGGRHGSCSAPTRRRPMRCGCASSARRMRARASRSAISRRAARARPGLAAIVTAATCRARTLRHLPEDARTSRCLRRGEVRFRGEAVLGLVGTREAVESVEDADLPITWTALTAARPASRRRSPTGALAIHAGRPDNVLTRGTSALRRRRRKAPRAGRRHGRRPVRDALRRARLYRAGGRLRRPDRRRSHRGLRLHPGALHGPRGDRARARRRAGERVRIRPTACGGGFGGKLDVSVQPLLAVAAWVTKRAGAHGLFAHRVDGLHHQAPPGARSAPRASADATAGSLAFEMRGRLQHRRLCLLGPDGRQPRAGARARALQGAERRNRTRAIYTNDTPAGAFRGFGVPQAAIAHECADGRSRREARHRPLGHPPPQRARTGRPHALGPAACALRPGCRNASTR